MSTKTRRLVHELSHDFSKFAGPEPTILNIHREGVTSDRRGLQVTFQRTIRVSDNNSTNNLPPSLGAFPLYNVSDYESKLPSDMTARGGYLLPMHRKCLSRLI